VRDGEFTYVRNTGPVIEFEEDEEMEAEEAAEEVGRQPEKGGRRAGKPGNGAAPAHKNGGGAGGGAVAAPPDGALVVGANGEVAAGKRSRDGKDAAADREADDGGNDGEGGDGDEGALFALHDVNISAGAGELVCVVGRVGSGKTSLARPSAR
jgi:ABC-type glutathione transport system ATPase component